MRLLLVNRFYDDHHTPTGRMLYDVARLLYQEGHDVRVITSRTEYAAHKRERLDGGIIAHVQFFPTGSGNRLVQWLFFWLQICIRLPFLKWDRCLLLTDPPFMSVGAWLTRGFTSGKRKVYLWTMDLYPEALVADGLISPDGFMNRFLRWMNNLGMSGLEGVIPLGNRQHQLLQEYGNWKDGVVFSIVVPPWDYRVLRKVNVLENRFLARNNWVGKKIALYAGNLGRGHSYRDILKAAAKLEKEGEEEWLFVFVCRGGRKPQLEIESEELDNVVVLDYVAPDETADLLWAADVHLITMVDGWQGIVVPSKLYGILETESPVLYIGPEDSDTAEEIIKYGAGIILKNGCGAESVVQTLSLLLENRYRKERVLDAGGARQIADFVTVR